jgi:hypothetical protein
MGFASRTYCLVAVLAALAMVVAPAASARVDTGGPTVYPPVERTVSVPKPVVTEAPGDFDWFSAGVGAAIATGLALLISTTGRVRRQSGAAA